MSNKETLKQIRKDLRTIKNEWVYKSYIWNGKKYNTKRYNNWFQKFRDEQNLSIVFPMFETQKAVIKHLNKYNKEV